MNCRTPLILMLLVAWPVTSASARQKVSLRQGINDYANVVNSGTEQALNAYLLELEQKTGAQLRVLTIKSTKGRDLYSYTMELAQREKLGQADKDNGVVVAIAVKDRKWRIVTGEGIEDTLPDLYCDSVAQQYFIPNFKRGDFSTGIYQGAVAMAQKVAADAGVTLSGAPKMKIQKSRRRTRSSRGGVPCFVIFFLFIVIGSILGGRRRRYYGTWGGGGLWQGILLGTLLNSATRSSSSWSAGSGWSGGFGGGGFGGFGGGGGGSFGGGGAGGSW